jgi:hypothetical protein
MERILAVTEVANLQITVGLVNLLGECTARQRRVLAPNACDAATPANGRARLPLPARRLPCEHFCYRWLRVAHGALATASAAVITCSRCSDSPRWARRDVPETNCPGKLYKDRTQSP